MRKGSGVPVPVGRRFGSLVVVGEAQKRYGNRYFSCLCDCGRHVAIYSANILSGKSKSCGCEKNKKTAERFTTHGMSNHSRNIDRRNPTYTSWQAMKNRCLNRNATDYCYYGALGVTICDSWRDSFENFYKDMGDRPTGYTLDRINPYLGYSKDNCRWADSHTQRINRRKDVK